jgi:hypothetical protein
MSSNINSAFKTLEKKLADATISTSLQVESILQEFDVAQKPEEDKTPALLKNIALGEFVLVRRSTLMLTYDQDPPQ